MKTITNKTKRTRTRNPNHKITTAYRISDELWAVLEPLLLPHPNTHRFGGGRPRVPDRLCADAIFYVLRTGCPWQALDQTELCAHATAHDRYQEWVLGWDVQLTVCGPDALSVLLPLVKQYHEFEGIEMPDEARVRALKPLLVDNTLGCILLIHMDGDVIG